MKHTPPNKRRNQITYPSAEDAVAGHARHMAPTSARIRSSKAAANREAAYDRADLDAFAYQDLAGRRGLASPAADAPALNVVAGKVSLVKRVQCYKSMKALSRVTTKIGAMQGYVTRLADTFAQAVAYRDDLDKLAKSRVQRGGGCDDVRARLDHANRTLRDGVEYVERTERTIVQLESETENLLRAMYLTPVVSPDPTKRPRRLADGNVTFDEDVAILDYDVSDGELLSRRMGELSREGMDFADEVELESVKLSNNPVFDDVSTTNPLYDDEESARIGTTVYEGGKKPPAKKSSAKKPVAKKPTAKKAAARKPYGEKVKSSVPFVMA